MPHLQGYDPGRLVLEAWAFLATAILTTLPAIEFSGFLRDGPDWSCVFLRSVGPFQTDVGSDAEVRPCDARYRGKCNSLADLLARPSSASHCAVGPHVISSYSSFHERACEQLQGCARSKHAMVICSLLDLCAMPIEGDRRC